MILSLHSFQKFLGGRQIFGRVDADGADVAVQIVYDLNGIGVVQVGNDGVRGEQCEFAERRRGPREPSP